MPFKIVRNDITKMQVDAIVNTANPLPVYASGTDTAIYEAAGRNELLSAREQIGIINPGEAMVTSGYKLPAKYIIHTVGPIYGTSNAEECLRLCYINSLKLAFEYNCESIAFPLIASGNYGYPKAEALQAAVSTISDFLLKEDMMVYLVVFDNESFEVSGKLFADIDSYIDARYVENKLEAEYKERTILLNDSVSEAEPNVNATTGNIAIPSFLKNTVSYTDTVRGEHKNMPVERSLDDVIAQMSETFQQRLLRLIDERGMTDVEVYKKANLDRKLFSKIRCNVDYKPKKLTAVALAVALRLSLDETKDLLARAELALSPSSKFDLIIEYFIEREIYDVYTINMALFKHEQPLLGE